MIVFYKKRLITSIIFITGDFKEIELTMFVDKFSAPLVTVGNCKLDEILVLHLVNGKDFFVSFSKAI